ncbi:hypothetical protein KUTeg_000272 [Tegillarca granosa]|uniref:Tetratricopeptide repeat protein n=1 Tax=Tegillarca granosa TaxID=220873 RepID=A0ABQ9FX35_TEGGR|nr:hypothetical protein KUTeg_000272 [Tegillarca granosa]
MSLAYNNRGFLKYKKVDFDGAVKDYSTSLTIVQDSAVTYYNRGMIHYRLGRFDEAIRDMNSSLSINPDFHDAKTGLLMSERDKEEKQKRHS